MASARRRKRRARTALVVLVGLLSAVLAVGAVASAQVLVRATPMSICLGTTLRPAVKFDRRTGGSKRYTVRITNPSGSTVFSRSGRARTTWRTWSYRPTRPGLHRTRYSVNARTQTFETQVLRCGTTGVAILDNDRDRALFTLPALAPGRTTAKCITVSYARTEQAQVRLYRTAEADDTLSPFLRLRVTRGTLPQFAAGSCTGFVPDATNYSGAGAGVVFDGPMSSYPTSVGTGILDASASAVETWAPGESHAYRIEVVLSDDDAAQGLSTTTSFVWHALA